MQPRAVIEQLRREILCLQGIRTADTEISIPGLETLNPHFPNQHFPTGAIHEFLFTGEETLASTAGFISGVLSALMQADHAAVWVNPGRRLFAPALKRFGGVPEHVIFLDLARSKDALWAMEEALHCEGLAAVIGEIKQMDFTASRRLQLAVEKSRVTGFILRKEVVNLQAIACIARWRITPLPTTAVDDLPGIGLPHWRVELLKIRNGKPGAWNICWQSDHFELQQENTSIQETIHRKAG
jgi:protein ImuA